MPISPAHFFFLGRHRLVSPWRPGPAPPSVKSGLMRDVRTPGEPSGEEIFGKVSREEVVVGKQQSGRRSGTERLKIEVEGIRSP